MIIRSSLSAVKHDILKYHSNKTFVFYFGTEDNKGKSWCSDCVIGNPLVRNAIVKLNCTLIEVPVGEKAAWKDKTHPLRPDISAIPTLVHTISKKQLIEDMSNVEEFLQSEIK